MGNSCTQCHIQCVICLSLQDSELGVLGLIVTILAIFVPLCCSCCHFWRDGKRKATTISQQAGNLHMFLYMYSEVALTVLCHFFRQAYIVDELYCINKRPTHLNVIYVYCSLSVIEKTAYILGNELWEYDLMYYSA